jgi:hypothetical protein
MMTIDLSVSGCGPPLKCKVPAVEGPGNKADGPLR